jgi:hypothetical protein
VADWHDPEFWPPEGQGCWLCHVNPPVVKLELRHGRESGPWGQPFSRPYALCLACLTRWFPGRDQNWVLDWLMRQTERRIKWEQERKTRLERDKQNLREWLHGPVR